MELKYVCQMCGKETINPTTISWCPTCNRRICRDCADEEHERAHAEPR